jgi:hypothetical protein
MPATARSIMQSFFAKFAAVGIVAGGFTLTGDAWRLMERGQRLLDARTVPSEAPAESLTVAEAVPVAASESVLTPMDTTELLLGVTTGSDSLRTAAVGTETDEELERKQSSWRVLLALALAALLVETIVASRGRRGTARRVTPASKTERTV